MTPLNDIQDLQSQTPQIIRGELVLPKPDQEQDSTDNTALSSVTETKPSEAKKLAKKYPDTTIRDEDDHNKVIAYYHPPSLTPEYDKPRIVQLSYAADVPMVNGVPFWERLPDEPPSYYEAFAHYRDLPDTDLQSPVRLIAKTARYFNIDPEVMEGVASAWMWDQRVQSYETYADILVQKSRAKKIIVMESEHSKIADKFLEKAEEALDLQDLEKVSPFVIMEWAKAAVAMKRLSLRVSPDQADDGEAHKQNSKDNQDGITLSGDNQKVQIVFNKEWQST